MSEQPSAYLSDRPHEPYSPSRLPYIEACPCWIGDGAPGPLAARGTAIGERLAQYMAHGSDPLDGADDADREALEYGMLALDSIRAEYPDLTWQSETFVATGITGCGGYLDLLSLDHLLGSAVLVEIKTGRGKRAPAGENRQVQAYAVGVFHDHPGIDEITAHLIECDHEKTTTAIFRRAAMAQLRSACKAIILNAQCATDASLTPGRHCGYCGRREQCPRLAESPDLALALIGERTLSPADYAGAMSAETLGETLTRVAPLAELVDAYCGALRHRVMTLLEAGAEIPGWRIKTMGGARSWADEGMARTAMIDAGMDLSLVITLSSPAQVEKRLGKEAKAIIAPYCKQGVRKSLLPIAGD